MSDGPYRSLPMSRPWKRLAEFAENVNFDSADTCAAATHALEDTWRKEVPAAIVDGIRAVFLEEQGGLFADAQITKVHVLLEDSAGYGLGRLVCEHAISVLNEGIAGNEGLVETTTRTLDAFSARVARQIEEHYCRKAPARLTRQVRDRIAQAIGLADLKTLARHFSNGDRRVMNTRSIKHTQIDDGVPLS